MVWIEHDVAGRAAMGTSAGNTPTMTITHKLGVIIAVVVGAYLIWADTGAQTPRPRTASSPWPERYDAALAQAKASGRPMLVNFTGSDWCGWCIRLRDEVFDTQAFVTWSQSRVVLLELDFPRSRRLEPEIVAQNESLAQRFSVDGFPTVLLLDAQGVEIARLGYARGGAQAWIDRAEAVLEKAEQQRQRVR
jgi:protein disulfide-isomerase